MGEYFSYPAKEENLKNFSSSQRKKVMIDEQRLQELINFSEKLGITFKNIDLLNTALTHTSYSNEKEHRKKERLMMNNERLEFLGDAVLELAASTYLYEHFGDLSEGELTRTRASIVCQTTLAKLAKKLDVGYYILISHGEEISGGRARTSTLEDTFEAIIGAIYLDQGWPVALDYVIRQLSSEFERARAGDNLKDYKTTLQEHIQRNPLSKISYVELSVDGPAHMRLYKYAVNIDGKYYGQGIGRSKKLAEQMAAKETLKLLGI